MAEQIIHPLGEPEPKALILQNGVQNFPGSWGKKR